MKELKSNNSSSIYLDMEVLKQVLEGSPFRDSSKPDGRIATFIKHIKTNIL